MTDNSRGTQIQDVEYAVDDERHPIFLVTRWIRPRNDGKCGFRRRIERRNGEQCDIATLVVISIADGRQRFPRVSDSKKSDVFTAEYSRKSRAWAGGLRRNLTNKRGRKVLVETSKQIDGANNPVVVSSLEGVRTVGSDHVIRTADIDDESPLRIVCHGRVEK